MEGGAWGLVVVASAFFIQVFVFGSSESIGVYNIEFLDYFTHDTVGVSLIASVNLAVFFCSGPLSSYLMVKLTYRKVCLIGSFLVVFGILLARLFLYIPALCVCLGFITGLGSGMVYVPSFVLCGLYYERHRSLATGVASCGCGLGVAFGPAVVGYLIQGYGWQGSLIVLAGLNLHLVVCSALLRQPPTVEPYFPSMEIEVPAPMNNRSPASVTTTGGEKSGLLTSPEARTSRSALRSAITAGRTTSDRQLHLKISRGRKSSEHVHVSFDIGTQDKGTRRTLRGKDTTKDKTPEECTSTDKNAGKNLSKTTNSDKDVVVSKNLPEKVSDDRSDLEKCSDREVIDQKRDPGDACEIWACDREQYEKATGEKRHHPEPTCDIAADVSNTHGKSSRDGAVVERAAGDRFTTDNAAGDRRLPESTRADLPDTSKAAKTSGHIYLLTDLGFVVYFLSNLLWNINTGMQTAFIADFARERGVARINAALLVTISGFGLVFGGLAGAVLGHQFEDRRVKLYASACVMFGLISATVPLGSEYDEYAGSLFSARLSIGVSLGLQVVVLADLIGTDALGDGMGYLMLSNGIGSFLGPYLAGHIRDETGNYDGAFYVGGAAAVASGVIMVLIPLLRPVCSKNSP